MDPLNPVVARRTALVAGLSGAGALALAACGGSASTPAATTSASAANSAASSTATKAPSSTSEPGTSTSEATTSEPTTAEPTTSEAPSSTRTSSPSSSAPPATDAIVALDDVKVGGSANAMSGGKPVVVARPNAKTVVCHTAICTHQGCTVQASGAKLDCPCHGSVFNAFTGAVENPPAPSPLANIAVKVVGGQVVPA